MTWTNGYGETTASSAVTVTTTTNTSTITISNSFAPVGNAGWYAYVTQAGGNTFTLQQTASSPTPAGTNFVLTAPPAITGAAPPSTNTTNIVLPTSATEGFSIVATVYQDPTGTPHDSVGGVRECFNITNGKRWAYYGGAWHLRSIHKVPRWQELP